MKYVKYNTGDQVWFDDLNIPVYCIDDRRIHYDFRTIKSSPLDLIKEEHLDVEILDELSNDTYFYNFTD